MSRLIDDVHVFDYFATYDYGDVLPSKTMIGKISSTGDYHQLVPSPDTRVEIERAPGVEEIRVIKNESGDYHVTANHDIARKLIEQIDQETVKIFQPDIDPFPETFGNPKNANYYWDIIQYDGDGDRLLPAIRRAGFITTMKQWNDMQTGMIAGYEVEEFVGLENTKTGDLWWATDELKEEVMKRRRQLNRMTQSEEENDDSVEVASEENEGEEGKA